MHAFLHLKREGQNGMDLCTAINTTPLRRMDGPPPEGALLALICHSQDLDQALEWSAQHSFRLQCLIAEDFGPHWQDALATQNNGAPCPPLQDMAVLPSMPHVEICYYSRRSAYGPLHSVAQRLRSLGLQTLYLCRPPLGVAEGRRCVPDFLEKYEARLYAIYASLSDEESRSIFAARIKALLTGNMGYLSLSPYACYQHPKVPCSAGFMAVDAGCAWGGLDVFSQLVGPAGRVLGFEPDGAGFSSIVPTANTKVVRCGLWHEQGTGEFSCAGSSTCLGRETTEGSVQRVPLVRLDDYLGAQGIFHVDFLKLDVEGAELRALQGAQELLRRCRPNLALCIYHNNSQDIVVIPEFINSLDLGYRLYVGQHAVNAYDTVLYAVSPHKANRTVAPPPTEHATAVVVPDVHKYHQAVLNAQGKPIFPGSWNPKVIANILTAGDVAFWQGKKVLDIGANTAGLSLELARMGADVCATEPDRRVSDLTRDLVLRCVQEEGLALNLTDRPLLACHELGSFDVICCLGLLYHFRYPQYILDYLSALHAQTLFLSSQTYASQELVAYNRKNMSQGWHYDETFSLAGWHPSHSLLAAMLRTAGFCQIMRLTDREYNFPEKPEGATNSAYYRAEYGEIRNPDSEKYKFI